MAGDQGCLKVKLIHLWSNLVINVFMVQLTHSSADVRDLAGSYLNQINVMNCSRNEYVEQRQRSVKETEEHVEISRPY